jgi:hypothetical protein
MNTHKQKILIPIVLLCLFLTGATLAAPLAANLERHVTGSGGGHSEVGIYTLDASIGQPLVGLDSVAPYALCSGYWCSQNMAYLYLPVIRR